MAQLRSDLGGDPKYGHQIQTSALPGLAPEGHVRIDTSGTPRLRLAGGLSADTRVGFRRAPTLAGRGLIDAVPETAIRALADPADRNGDGISGRVSEIDGRVGRFGWKADHPTLAGQIALAFALDLGLSSRRYPNPNGDCTLAQNACQAAPHGGDALSGGYEVSDTVIDLVTTFAAALGTPRPGTPRGRSLFAATGCADCHVPAITGLGGAYPVFSDLLLHDMGRDLADDPPGDRPDEWRTAPLIGLKTAKSRYLHDGRAADLREAIMWHGGEAARSRDLFTTLGPADQSRLLAFLKGL